MVSGLLVAVLAYGHILAAMAWLGGGILMSFVIAPSLRRIAPPAALEFNAKVLPPIIRFVQVAAGMTIIFGLLLLYFFQGGDLSSLMDTTQGYILSVGILFAVVTAVVSMGFAIPAFRKISRISKAAVESNQPPSPDMAKYARRARYGSMAGLVLLLFVLAMMVASGFLF